MNRSRLILLGCLVLFVLAAVSAYLRYPEQKSVAKLTYSPGAVAQVKVPKPDDERVVRLDLLEGRSGRFSGYRRNIFRPLFGEPSHGVLPNLIPPPPPPPPPLPVPEPPKEEATPVQKEMAKFTFLGFVVKDSKKTLFLSQGGEILLVRKGDRIARQYDVINVTDEALTVKVVADGSEIVIPLVENKPLAAPRR